LAADPRRFDVPYKTFVAPCGEPTNTLVMAVADPVMVILELHLPLAARQKLAYKGGRLATIGDLLKRARNSRSGCLIGHLNHSQLQVSKMRKRA